MLIKRLTLICLVTVATVSFSKDTDSCFDLKKYVPPAFNYNLLEFKPDISLDGGNFDRYSSSYENSKDGEPQTDDFASWTNQPSTNLQFRHKYYGWKGQTEWQIGNELSYNSGSYNLHPYSIDYLSYQEYADIANSNNTITGKTAVSAAYYFKWPYFLGGGISPYVNGNMSRSREISKHVETVNKDTVSKEYRFSNNKSSEKSYYGGFSANCRVGAGHIDDVSFAIAALNMFDKIAETEKTYTGCNAKRVQDLASLIEKLRKRRAFDSRIAKIENIDSLCKLIKEAGIVKDLTPRTILEIADEWDYVSYQTRMSGFFLEFSPTVNYQRSSRNSYSSTISSQKNDLPESYKLTHDYINEFDTNNSTVEYDILTESNQLNYSAVIKAQYEHPITRYFQCGFDADIIPSIVQTWNTYVDVNGTYPMLSAEESARFGYFPNTRTSITISESIRYTRMYDYFKLDGARYELFDYSVKGDLDERQLFADLQLNATYYVSPQLQIRINAGINWSDTYERSYGQLSRLTEKPSLYSEKAFRYQFGGNVVWEIF